jgi:hypothetical protein
LWRSNSIFNLWVPVSLKVSSVFHNTFVENYYFSRLSKTSLPEGIVSYIKMCTTSYGKVSQCSDARKMTKIQLTGTSWQLISNNEASSAWRCFWKITMAIIMFCRQKKFKFIIFFITACCCSTCSVQVRYGMVPTNIFNRPYKFLSFPFCQNFNNVRVETFVFTDLQGLMSNLIL